MTAVREAVLLPFLFFTDRPRWLSSRPLATGSASRGASPSLFSLVLAVLLVRRWSQRHPGPERLMHGSRTPLANINGLIVLVSLFAGIGATDSYADAARGRAAHHGGLFALRAVAQHASRVTRKTVRLLRSLAIGTGAAFLLKFIVLARSPMLKVD